MKQKYFSAKTGQEVQRGALKEQPKAAFDGKKPEPKKEAAPAPQKQRRERSDSLVQRIIGEIKKMATAPDSGQKEAATADAEKKRIKRSGGDVANPKRKSAEEKADSYDAAPISARPTAGRVDAGYGFGPLDAQGFQAAPAAPPILPPGMPPVPAPSNPLPPSMPPVPSAPPAPSTAPRGGSPAPPINPGPMSAPSAPGPLPFAPPTPKPPSITPPKHSMPQNRQAPTAQRASMDAVYDGLMSAFIRRTQNK